MIAVRQYGSEGPRVVVLHGGPGAPGSMAPVARGLAGDFRVLEPLQRRSGGAPLTVARHVADLLEVIEAECGEERPALVGSSWGAVLALAFAAEHPERAGPLALVGCGTLDPAARAILRATVAERIGPELQTELDRIAREVTDPDRRLAQRARLILPLYAFDPVAEEDEVTEYDARGNQETWGDVERLGAAGVFPAAFARISAPVLMLHGAHDPHPGGAVRTSLAPHLPQLEYVGWERCGHFPWQERHTRDEFFSVLRDWLVRVCRE